MKTNNTKSELIQQFAEKIDSSCTTKEELISLIGSINTMTNFFICQQQKPHSLMLDMLRVKEVVAEYSGECELRASEDVADLLTSVLIQAECMQKEIGTLYDIMNDLHPVMTT